MKIAIYAGFYNYWGELNPEELFNPNGKQFGGGETAVMNIAFGLASHGHTVYLGANVGRPFDCLGVRFIPEQTFVPTVRTIGVDVTVAWDAIQLYRFVLDTKYRVVAFQLNDTEVGVYDYMVDAYFHPSNWHAKRFNELFGVPAKKQYPYMTNGTSAILYSVNLPRRPIVLYCSSPDRGLHHLLRWWPKIKKDRPNAELHIFYDMSRWLQINATVKTNTSEIATEVSSRLTEFLNDSNMGVVYHGGVSKLKLAVAMGEASVLAYPCDPVSPTEGFSMTILDSWRAGLNVITSDADALGEIWSNKPGITVLPRCTIQDEHVWIAHILNALDEVPERGPRNIPNVFYWDHICNLWESLFREVMYG